MRRVALMAVVLAVVWIVSSEPGPRAMPIGVNTVHAQAPEAAAELTLYQSAIRRLSYNLLPITVQSVSGSSVRLVEIQYCGASNPTSADAVGLGVPPGTAKGATTTLLQSACKASLVDLAAGLKTELGDSVDWTAAVRLRISWSPWRLELFVTDAVRNSVAAPDLVSNTPVTTLSTDSISHPESPTPLAAAFSFFSAGAVVQLFEDTKHLTALQGTPYFPGPSGEDRQTEGVASVSLAFLSRSLRARPQTVPVPQLGQTAQITFTQVATGPLKGSLRLTGTVQLSDAPAAAFQIDLEPSNNDLRFKTISITAPQKDCSSIADAIERIKCNAENKIARDLAAKASAKLQSDVENKPFRPISPDRRLPLTLGTKHENLQIETQSTAADAKALLLYVRAILDEVKP